MPRAKDVAAWIQAELAGDPEVEIRDVGSIESAKAGDVVFALDAKFLAAAEDTPAAAVIVPRGLSSGQKTLFRVDEPRIAFATLVDRFRPPARPVPGLHANAVVARDARVAKTASVGAFAVIESGAQVGERAVIGPGCAVGARASVGEDSVLHARVTLYHECVVGARCILHSGTVIGADGFGYAQDAQGRHIKIRQVGNVVVGDDVEMGANCAVDRATFGSTTIGDGTKLDNMVHVAHNCRVGRHCILAAQVGISGSCEIGDHAILLGQVGVADHMKIGKRAIILAQSGIGEEVPDGTIWFGSPAQTRMQRERQMMALRKLPDLLKRVKEIERTLGLRNDGKTK